MSPPTVDEGSGWVDLRSDTVTKPTEAMRRAMAEAEVGDDCYGEDPTVRALEEGYAERVGKPTAMLVPSGVMANQVALLALAEPGTGIIAGRRQHIVAYENGAASRNAGVQVHAVDDADGSISAADVSWARQAADHHQLQPGLVCVENTHMAAGGVPWSLDDLKQVAEAAGPLPLHMDGARLFNAEVSTAIPADSYASFATTVMTCLSKGLCAPVGSVLAGPADVMAQARTERSRLGGAMRQAGVIAAAGLVALTQMVRRLVEDHHRAATLAQAVAERWPGQIDPEQVVTNLVCFQHPGPGHLLAHLRSMGVLAGTIAPGVVRLVTHHDIDDEDIERAVAAIRSAP